VTRGRRVSGGLALSPDGKWVAFLRKGRGGSGIWVVGSSGRGQRRLSIGSRPAWSPDGRRLAFLGPLGRSGLMTIRVDGSGLRELVGAKVSHRAQPVWSPAGGWIAYVAGKDELRVVRPNGRRSRRVARINSTSARSVFCWSPDGRRLAYFGSTGYLYTVPMTGGRPRRLKAAGLEPQWSPDGARIAFTENGTTMVIRASGTGPPRFVTGGDAPSWSPDSSRLAVARGNQVWVARANGRGAWRVSRGEPFSEFSGVSGRPAWTPDGRRIFFSRKHLDPGQLMVVPASGGRSRRLTPLNRLAESNPAWSPDGRTIAFTGTVEGERGGSAVYLIRADGSQMRRLTPSAWLTAEPTWSPDGRRVLFMRWIKPTWVLFAMSAAGGKATRIAAVNRGNPAWAPGKSIALDGIDVLTPVGLSHGRITQPPQWGYDHEPDWAPDGRHFAFTRVRKGCGPQCAFSYLTVGELGSTSAQQTTAEVTSPKWSPDGTRIAAVTYAEGTLVTMRPDGSDLRAVGVDLEEHEDGIELDWGPAR
jgi:Tol biopolymer transport system component